MSLRWAALVVSSFLLGGLSVVGTALRECVRRPAKECFGTMVLSLTAGTECEDAALLAVHDGITGHGKGMSFGEGKVCVEARESRLEGSEVAVQA